MTVKDVFQTLAFALFIALICAMNTMLQHGII